MTPSQFRAQIWNAVIHGARGIVFFPFDVGETPWSYDTTPSDVIDEMRIQSALITQISLPLQGEINPSGFSASVEAPLEAGWRDTEEAAYFLVLNLSGSPIDNITVTLTGVSDATAAEALNESRSLVLTQGVLTDTFGPHQLHIYVVRH